MTREKTTPQKEAAALLSLELRSTGRQQVTGHPTNRRAAMYIHQGEGHKSEICRRTFFFTYIQEITHHIVIAAAFFLSATHRAIDACD